MTEHLLYYYDDQCSNCCVLVVSTGAAGMLSSYDGCMIDTMAMSATSVMLVHWSQARHHSVSVAQHGSRSSLSIRAGVGAPAGH